ncbi:hypothetical protein ACNQFN_22405 [Thauera butanivorans]|uniref:hypothetical protein n=1 Tax=Thauera butanivorans TaxID=86174 RepID=UPI003AB55D07
MGGCGSLGTGPDALAYRYALKELNPFALLDADYSQHNPQRIVFGGEGSDPGLKGGDLDDRLYGGAGDDMLDGKDGRDRLDSGMGNDRMSARIEWISARAAPADIHSMWVH